MKLLAFARGLFAPNGLTRLFHSILPRERAYRPLREALVIIFNVFYYGKP